MMLCYTDLMSKQHSTAKRDVILLISIPLGLLVLLGAIVYIPQVLARPTQDFIYSACKEFHCSGKITVSQAVVGYQPSDEDLRYYEPPELYFYDVSENSSRLISLEDASNHQLDNSSKSSEGYSLAFQSSSSSFLGWSDNAGSWSLKNGLLKKPLNIESSNSNYRSYSDENYIKLVGWVN